MVLFGIWSLKISLAVLKRFQFSGKKKSGSNENIWSFKTVWRKGRFR